MAPAFVSVKQAAASREQMMVEVETGCFFFLFSPWQLFPVEPTEWKDCLPTHSYFFFLSSN